MTKIKISSPVEGLNITSAVGPTVLNFKDSVAEIDSDELTPGLRRFLDRNGYGIGGGEAKGRETETPQPPDPRKVNHEQIGSKIRDAAVNPKDKDFLEPSNAGKANPHGTEVVSPEIHASQGIRPVKGGPVHVDDPAQQASSEKAHAAAATDGTPVTLTDEERELLGLDDEDFEDDGREGDEAEAGVTKPDSEDEDDDLGDQGDGTGPAPDSESTGDAQPDPADGEAPVEELKGEALNDALRAAELPISGSAKEKRERLQAHRDGAES